MAHWPADLLPLPNVSAAGAPDRVGRLLFSQLLFADWTGFGHYIRHSRDLSDQGSLPQRARRIPEDLTRVGRLELPTASVVCPTSQVNGTRVRLRWHR
jgi:hypothetical protein